MIEAGLRELTSFNLSGDYDGQEVVFAVVSAALAVRLNGDNAKIDRADE